MEIKEMEMERDKATIKFVKFVQLFLTYNLTEEIFIKDGAKTIYNFLVKNHFTPSEVIYIKYSLNFDDILPYKVIDPSGEDDLCTNQWLQTMAALVKAQEDLSIEALVNGINQLNPFKDKK